MIIIDQDEEIEQDDFGQEIPDPNIYQPPDEQDDENELDRRIRRSHERLRRLTIIGAPDWDAEALCQDTLNVEGGFDTGYAVQFQDCGGGVTAATGACCHGACSSITKADCSALGGIYFGDNTACPTFPDGQVCTVPDCFLCPPITVLNICPCFLNATFVGSFTLSGVTLPGCCVGLGFTYTDCGLDGCINDTYTFGVQPPSWWEFCGVYSYAPVDRRVIENTYEDESCTILDEFTDVRAPTIVAGCTTAGSHPGFFIEAWVGSTRPLFAAHGANSLSMLPNELVCGSPPAISFLFPDPTVAAIGQGGHATFV